VTIEIAWIFPIGLPSVLGTVTADGQGSFYRSTGLTFTIPAEAPVGINPIVGRGVATGVLGRTFVTVQ
jgi:hypothetical protein